jgi:hypothetical protein
VELAGHGRQSLRPGPGVIWPAGQDEHAEAFALPAYVPAAHAVHSGRPSTTPLLRNPASHKHTVALAAAVEFAGHGTHSFLPSACEM